MLVAQEKLFDQSSQTSSVTVSDYINYSGLELHRPSQLASFMFFTVMSAFVFA